MSKISYFVMDVDGTLTDGKIYMGISGEVCKAFDVKDGYGIHNILIPMEICPVVITGRKSKIVEKRCDELGIDQIYQNVINKKIFLDDILKKGNCTYSNIAYIGDDINDLECMKAVKEAGGIIGCPADAVKEIIDIVDFVSTKDGGNGAVREFIDWIINL